MPAKTPEELEEMFTDAVNRRDLDALAALYEPDAIWVTEPGQSVSGVPAIREVAAGYFALNPTFDMKTKAILTSGDVTLVYSSWTLSGTDGGEPLHLAGDSTAVLRRGPDGWRYVVDDPFGQG